MSRGFSSKWLVAISTSIAAMFALSLALAGCKSSAGTPVSVEQSAKTASYAVKLELGPPEKMLTMEEAKTAKSGEVMVGGAPMAAAGMEPNHHLEVKITDLKTGKVVTGQKVTIKVTDDKTKQTQDVAAVAMYGIGEGPDDTHYGNNVTLMPGSYTVVVTVGSESATLSLRF